MAKKVSDKVEIKGRAVLESIMPIGHFANPVPANDTTFRDLAYRLVDAAVKLGIEPTEAFEYEIIVKRFFEGIDGLVEKGDKLFYKRQLFAERCKDREEYHYEYKGVFEVVGKPSEEIFKLKNKLEELNYLLMFNMGPCATV